MGRQNAGKKSYRALDLLMGLGDPEIHRQLARYGFDEEELSKGWGLLRACADVRRASPAPEGVRFDVGIKRLDEWENRWFVVADAALKHAHPEAAAWLFQNLSRSSGGEVVQGLMVFLGRVTKLHAGEVKVKQAAEASQLLKKRGLTEDVLEEGERLLRAVHALPESEPEVRNPEAEQQAEDALWAWYLEWSGIARAVLSEKRLLNHIGFGKVGRPKGS